jgi:Lar family restriction alleviation protein
MTDELKPCPFCASTDLREREHYIQHAVNGHHEWTVNCYNCGAVGPNSLSIDDARRMWNMRREKFPAPYKPAQDEAVAE